MSLRSKLAPHCELDGRWRGVIVVSVPKCGTNFLSRYLAHLTGWQHRWGRPSRDPAALQRELPTQPDPDVVAKAIHLIGTPSDLMLRPESERPPVFGNRRLQAGDRNPKSEEHTFPLGNRGWVLAEHPLHSLAYFLRNPRQVSIVTPSEVVGEAQALGYEVLFLSRNLKDIVNSLAHFLHAGTRYVQFRTLADALEICVQYYAPVLAHAIRTWKSEFQGMQINYETLTLDTRAELSRICSRLRIKVDPDQLISSTSEFRTFTFRKGGVGDWRNFLSAEISNQLEQSYPDLV